jgi:hypothetical protein
MSEVVSKIYDTSSLFLSDVIIDRLTVVVPAGTAANPVVIKQGTVLGQVLTTGRLKPLDIDEDDGSQLPCAVAIKDIRNSLTTVQNIVMDVAIQGKFNQNKLVFAVAGQSVDSIVPDYGLMRILMSQHGIVPIRGEQITDAYVI